MDALISIYNQPLKEDLLVTYFEQSIIKDSYWNYYHMDVQFEQVVGVLKGLHLDRD